MNDTARLVDNTTRLERALARSTVYGVLSDMAFYPRDGAVAPASVTAPKRRAELEAACRVLSQAGYDEAALQSVLVVGAVFMAPHAGPAAEDYVRIFGHTVSTQCPPYEAQYGTPHLFEQTRVLSDLGGFYGAFGLEVRREAGERPDHLGIELEFMQVLTYKEAYALKHHGVEHADLCREAQEKFLCEHLATWIDDFAGRLIRRAGSGPYAAYAEALRRYVASELTHLNVERTRRKTLEPQPAVAKPPSCSEVCGGVLPLSRTREGNP